jgi:hypothetical protein
MDRDTQIVILDALKHILLIVGRGYPGKQYENLVNEIDKLEQYNTEYAENKKAAFPDTIPSDE